MTRGLSRFKFSADPPPARGELPPDVEKAARTVARDVWGEPYRPLRGVMHYGTGPAHAVHLRRAADQWESLAAAARVCADYLGDGELDPSHPAYVDRLTMPPGEEADAR